MRVAEVAVKLATDLPPMVTPVTAGVPVKLVPVRVIEVPAGPEVVESAVTVAGVAAAFRVNSDWLVIAGDELNESVTFPAALGVTVKV
jgi:hypothetical protein